MNALARNKSGLRPIADPFVVAPPKGVRIRTRVHLTPEEQTVLEQIGVFLGGQYRATLVDRIALGAATKKEQAAWRQVRKQALTAETSSRWAGAITRTAIDSYDLGMRGLGAHVDSLTAAISTLGARLAAPVGGNSRDLNRPHAKPVRGYASEAEWFHKSRRKAHLETRLAQARARQEAGQPRIVVGGSRLWRNRQNLADTPMTVAQWEKRWAEERMFLTADGESGKRFGNETIRVTDEGVLMIKVPGALVPEHGTRLTIAAPVSLSTHRGDEWADRIAADRAIRYDLHRDQRGRWYLDASWGYEQAAAVPLVSLRSQRTLGVDLNAGHVDAAVVDPHGNPIGVPERLDFAQASGWPPDRRYPPARRYLRGDGPVMQPASRLSAWRIFRTASHISRRVGAFGADELDLADSYGGHLIGSPGRGWAWGRCGLRWIGGCFDADE